MMPMRSTRFATGPLRASASMLAQWRRSTGRWKSFALRQRRLMVYVSSWSKGHKSFEGVWNHRTVF